MRTAVKQNCVAACERFTSRQNIPGDRVGDGCEDPVELSEGSASVIEPARDPATQHNTDGCVSRAHCMSHSLLRGQSGNCSVLSSQHIWRNLHLHLGAYSEAEKKCEAGYVCTHALVCRTYTVTLWAQDLRHRHQRYALFSSDHMWEPRAKGFRVQSSRNKLQVDFLTKLITNQFVRASVIVNSN